MKTTSFLSLLLSGASFATAGVLQRAATCNADSCARAVTGTSGGATSAHRADCSSFLAYTAYPVTTKTVTVTPARSTLTSVYTTVVDVITYTQTTTLFLRTTDSESYGPTPTGAQRRDAAASVGETTVMPTAVPTYAAACSGTARYASACECWGVSTSVSSASSTRTVTTTVTAPTPVTTVSKVATSTVLTPHYVFTTAPLYVDEIPCGNTLYGDIKVQCEATNQMVQPNSPSQIVSDWDTCVQNAMVFSEHAQLNAFTYEIATKNCTYLYLTDKSYESLPGVVFGYYTDR